jgi:hypothetical protein
MQLVLLVGREVTDWHFKGVQNDFRVGRREKIQRFRFQQQRWGSSQATAQRFVASHAETGIPIGAVVLPRSLVHVASTAVWHELLPNAWWYSASFNRLKRIFEQELAK